MVCRAAHRMIIATTLLLAPLPLLTPGAANAGPNANARFLVHLSAPLLKNGCGLSTHPPDCHGIETRGQVGSSYFAYVIVSNVSTTAGLQAAQFGVRYDGAAGQGVDVHSWTNCAELEFSSTGWPASGGGNLLVWNPANCHPPTVGGWGMAVAGYFYLSAYSPDELELTPRPLDNLLRVGDCNGNEENIQTLGTINPLGWATFSAAGTSYGSVPCGDWGGGCRVRGPEFVTVGQTGINFTMDPRDVRSFGTWYVYGNAQIVSSDNASAVVNAPGPGTFVIGYLRETGCVEGCGCGVTVTVIYPTSVQSTTWSSIKAMHHREE